MIALVALAPVLVSIFGLAPVALAQDDPNEAPLGDVARNMRKKSPSGQGVIDNDNLSQVMNQAESKRGEASVLKFLMAGESQGFRVSAPDVSCSLSFSANAKALLSSQYAQMDMPADRMAKLAGPATIEGDALTLSVFNGTDWHVSEVDVALTVIRKNTPEETSGLAGADVPSSAPEAFTQSSDVRPEKKPDTTVIYRMRAAAPPWAKTTFSAPLNLGLAPGDEWHWALVQAKGYPPQSDMAKVEQSTAQASSASSSSSPVIPASLLQPDSSYSALPSAPPLPQNPQ